MGGEVSEQQHESSSAAVGWVFYPLGGRENVGVCTIQHFQNVWYKYKMNTSVCSLSLAGKCWTRISHPRG